MRSILKKLGMNQYYEHIPKIVHRLQGTSPPNISRATEDKLQGHVSMIKPFLKHSPRAERTFCRTRSC